MILNKSIWNYSDKIEFIDYLNDLKNEDKVIWTKNIVNTNMKVLAIKSPQIKSIIREILKGNYISFLELNVNDYYECTLINAGIISKIKDFKIQKYYLDKYVKIIDNWASCDTLKFNIKNKENEYLKLSKKYITSKKNFIRRVGIIILFEFIKNKDYLDIVFNMIKDLSSEEDYYVNMAISWLLCESFIKNRKETLNLLKEKKLNRFVTNKMISKCRDSYRVTKKDKEMLLNYRA